MFRFFVNPIIILLTFILIIDIDSARSQESASSSYYSLKDSIKAIYKTQPESVDGPARRMMTIAMGLNDQSILADAYTLMADVKMRQAKREESILLCDTAVMLNLKINNKKNLSDCYAIYGSNYQNKPDYENAVKYHLLAIRMAEDAQHYDIVNFSYRSLAKISQVQGKNDQALKYLNKAINITPKTKNKDTDLLNYHSLGEHYESVGNIPLAIKNYEKSYDLAMSRGKLYQGASTKSIWAVIYAGTDLNKTLIMMLEAQEIFDKTVPTGTFSLNNINNIGEVFSMFLRDDKLLKSFQVNGIKGEKSIIYQKASSYMKKSLQIAQLKKDKFNEMNALGNLANLYQFMGEYKEAFANLQKYQIIKDTIFSQKSKNAIAALESEKELINLHNLNKQKSIINQILWSIIGVVLIIIFFGAKNLMHKQNIQQHKLNDLERSKQLATTEALLKGQEEERKRLAQDLHDGLGGMLNGVKLQINHLAEELVMSPHYIKILNDSLQQLDFTIAELRKVSHNLMPDSLIRFGLIDAVSDFCRLQSSQNRTVVFQKIGESRILTDSANLYIYRIIQELITNSIKHGDASQIICQIAFNDTNILVTVDDNGRGFDISRDVEIKDGLGLKNVRQRVDYLHGQMELESKPEKGTSVNIELPL